MRSRCRGAGVAVAEALRLELTVLGLAVLPLLLTVLRRSTVAMVAAAHALAVALAAPARTVVAPTRPAEADRHAGRDQCGDLIGLCLRDRPRCHELGQLAGVSGRVDGGLGRLSVAGGDQGVELLRLRGRDGAALLELLHLALLVLRALGVRRALALGLARMRALDADRYAGRDQGGDLIGLCLRDRARRDERVESLRAHRRAQLRERAGDVAAGDLALDRGGLLGGQRTGLLELVHALSKAIALHGLDGALDLRLRHAGLGGEVAFELLVLGAALIVAARDGLGHDGGGDCPEADDRCGTAEQGELAVAAEARTGRGRRGGRRSSGIAGQ